MKILPSHTGVITILFIAFIGVIVAGLFDTMYEGLVLRPRLIFALALGLGLLLFLYEIYRKRTARVSPQRYPRHPLLLGSGILGALLLLGAIGFTDLPKHPSLFNLSVVLMMSLSGIGFYCEAAPRLKAGFRLRPVHKIGVIFAGGLLVFFIYSLLISFLGVRPF